MGEPLTLRGAALLAALLASGCVEDAFQFYQAHHDAGSPADAAVSPDAGQDAGPGVDAGGCAIPTLNRVCSSAGWCWENPLPHGNPIHALWTESPSNAWAVGAAGTLLHWDGHTWKPVASPTEQDMLGIWGSGAKDIWAVGQFATLLHYDCSGWIAVPQAPGAVDSATLRGIFGTGAADIWAVGDDGAFHFNGSGWDAQPAPGTPQLNLVAVWGDRPDDYWAVGDGGIATHFDGTSWSAPEPVSTAPLTSVWTSGGEVWAAGLTGVFHRSSAGQWAPALTCRGEHFSSVWGSGPSDLWAAGTNGALWHSSGGNVPGDCTLDAGSWAPASVAPVDLLAGASSGPAASWVVGAGGTIGVWDGIRWQLQLGGSAASIDAVWAGGGEAFAAGTGQDGNGAFYARGPSLWTSEAPLRGIPAPLTSLDGRAPSDLWAVDGQGTVWHRDDAGWSSFISLPGYSGAAIFETNDRLFTAGNAGSIYQSAIMPPGFTLDSAGDGGINLHALWGPSSGGAMWAVGGGGSLFQWDGGSEWTAIPSGMTVDLFGLWADSPLGTFFEVGRAGAIAHGPAGLLNIDDNSPTSADLFGVWGANAQDVWVVGDLGRILHWDGNLWTEVPSGSANRLRAVYGDPDGGVWAVGEHGTILHKQ